MYLTSGFSTQILTQGLVRGIDNFPLLAIPFLYDCRGDHEPGRGSLNEL